MGGQLYKLSVTADTGYAFTGWIGPDCGTAFDITADTVCEASFDTATYPVTVTLQGEAEGLVQSEPFGIYCTSGACTANFSYGSTVKLIA